MVSDRSMQSEFMVTSNTGWVIAGRSRLTQTLRLAVVAVSAVALWRPATQAWANPSRE